VGGGGRGCWPERGVETKKGRFRLHGEKWQPKNSKQGDRQPKDPQTRGSGWLAKKRKNKKDDAIQSALPSKKSQKKKGDAGNTTGMHAGGKTGSLNPKKRRTRETGGQPEQPPKEKKKPGGRKKRPIWWWGPTLRACTSIHSHPSKHHKTRVPHPH